MRKRLFWIVLTGTPMAFLPAVAHADEVGDLVPWSQFFARTDDKVEECHFALKAAVTFEGDGGNHSAVPHLEGSTLTYAVEDASNWPDSCGLDETAMDAVESVWGEGRRNVGGYGQQGSGKTLAIDRPRERGAGA